MPSSLRPRPSRSFSSAAASKAPKRRSRAVSSSSSRLARRRASANGGSVRVDSTTRRFGRAAVEQDGELFVHFTVAEPVVVLEHEHEHDRPRQRRDRIDQLREDGFGDARRPDARHRCALPGRFRTDAAHRFADASHRGIAETITRVIHARITTSRVRGGNLAP